MNTILFDGPERQNLLPFTFTRPVADIRVGIMSLREKWEFYLQTTTSTKTEAYLAEKWPLKSSDDNLFVNPAFLPTKDLVNTIGRLDFQEKLMSGDTLIACRTQQTDVAGLSAFTAVQYGDQLIHIGHCFDIFSNNSEAIAQDFRAITHNRRSEALPQSVYAVQSDDIFIEAGAKIANVSLNAENGPIYIGKNAEIMEGCHVRGPFSLGAHSVLKMGAKIYGGATFGPHSKVGGEVSNSVIFGYTNKGHDGFLGNAVLGEWCNLGADTNNSNLKNDYSTIKLWNYQAERFLPTGLQFCGLMMGDHSKTGINTMFNTGTVVGVSANLFGPGFPRNFIPSFSWGGSKKIMTYRLKKVFEVAEMVMKRRHVKFSDIDRNILTHVFNETDHYRRD